MSLSTPMRTDGIILFNFPSGTENPDHSADMMIIRFYPAEASAAGEPYGQFLQFIIDIHYKRGLAYVANENAKK